MELEKQVCSLELAIQLKELGVPQESLWWYRYGLSVSLRCTLYPAQIDTRDVYHKYAAFTAAELGELLPHGCYSRHGVKGFTCGPRMNQHKIRGTFRDDTEADARAKMLIYLLENKLISLPVILGE